MDHGTIARTIDIDVDIAQTQINLLAEVGIDYDAITRNLQDVGVEKFKRPFASLLKSIREKSEQLVQRAK